MPVDPTLLALEAAGGFTAGLLIGYAVRKLAKLVLVLVGFMLLPMFFLWQLGIVQVNWEALDYYLRQLVSWLGMNIASMAVTIADAGVMGVSGLVGFAVGLSGGIKQTIWGPKKRFVTPVG